MRRKSMTMALVLLMTGAVTFTSCIGSFGLTNNLLSWNRTVGSKFANELVFFAFWILPVYEVAVIADVLVLNSIEFWSGSNPVASNDVKAIDTENGRFLVKQTNSGYEITNVEQETTTTLVFNEANQTWSVEANGELVPFMSFIDENNVRVYLENGSTMDVELSEAGMVAFHEAVQAYAPAFAAL